MNDEEEIAAVKDQIKYYREKLALYRQLDAVRREYLRAREKAAAPAMLESYKPILEAVCREWNIPDAALFGRSKTNGLCDPRQVAMSLIYDTHTISQSALGDLFHREHSTITHALQSVRSKYETERPFRERVDRVRAAMK